MTATTISSSRGRGGYRDSLGERWALGVWALPLILVVAALNFLWQLGSSSFFTDEAFSVLHSLPSLGTIANRVAHTETTPWTYFLLLHEWLLRTGTQTEWVVRLPSAIAGVALVWAVYWMAKAFVSRPAALGAAALCAISPIVLAYAQEARAYVFAMLSITIAVGATVRATHRDDHRFPLLALGALTALLAIWFHYTAASVIIGLCVWVASRPILNWREKAGFIGACAVGSAALLPLFISQYDAFPNGGDIQGNVNLSNVIQVIETPFAHRLGTAVTVVAVLGAIIVLVAVAALLFSPQANVTHRRLLAGLGAVAVVTLVILGLAGKHIVITRYTVVAAPLLITAVVAACAQLPRPAAGALAVAALAVSVAGLIDNHSRSGFYPPTRQAIDYIAPREHPGDYMFSPGFPLTDIPIFYYDTRRLRPKLQFVGLNDSGVVRHEFRLRKRIWLIEDIKHPTYAAALAQAEPLLRRFRYRTASMRLYSTSMTLAVMLVVPDASVSS